MSALEPLIKPAFDLVRDGAVLDVKSEANVNRLAYALPQGTTYEEYAPWSSNLGVLRQVYYESEPVTGAPVELKFTVRWEYTVAQQYIENVDVDIRADIFTGYTLDASIQFSNPRTVDNAGLEMAQIPFKITVRRSHPVYGIKQSVMHGEIRGDGGGYLNPPE